LPTAEIVRDEVVCSELTHDHLVRLTYTLREEDRLEIERSGYPTALACLREMHQRSCRAWAAHEKSGEVIACWGLVIGDPVAGTGLPWLFTGRALQHHKKEFLRLSRASIAIMESTTPRLVIMVDARYAKAIRWAKWLGFEFSDPRPNQLGYEFVIGEYGGREQCVS